VKLHVETAGDGAPVVFLHAGICDGRMWDEPFARLAARHRVVRCDLRGFGRSPAARAPYAHRRDVTAMLRELGVAGACVVGASMAGRIALEVALDAPELVERLVLVGAAGGGETPAEALRAAWVEVDELVRRGELSRANQLELDLWLDGAPDAVRASVGEMNGAILARQAENDDEEARTPGVEAELERVAVPTLVIAGDRDQPHVLENARRFAARIPGAELVVLPGVAHLPSLERPDEFARLMGAFLR
jgi:pimeloyl-ACP methyl ester carboxylesterase